MKKKSIGGMLVVTAFLGIFMNIHHPVTPTLFSSMELPSRIFGTSFAMMCFFSFLTSPFWGEMSDAKGRLTVFLISCIGYGIAQISLGYSSNEFFVLLSRSLAGVFASGAGIASMAYVADLYDAQSRGRGMSIYIAVQSISLAAGYLIGGFLGVISFKFAFTFQGVGMILLGIFAYKLLQESYESTKRIDAKNLLKTINPFTSFVNAKSLITKALVYFLFVVVLSSFASTCYDNAFNYYLKDQLNFSSAYNGIIKAIVGLIGLVANFTINMWIIEKTKIRKSLTVVLLLCSTATFGILLQENLVIFIIANLFFFTVNAIYQPIVQTLMIEGRSNDEIGIATGLINAVKSLGSVLGALVAGMVYDISSLFPFLLAGVMFTLSTCFSFIYSKMK